MRRYDVAVLGGGFAGVGAALAEQEWGLRFFLLKKGTAWEARPYMAL